MGIHGYGLAGSRPSFHTMQPDRSRCWDASIECCPCVKTVRPMWTPRVLSQPRGHARWIEHLKYSTCTRYALNRYYGVNIFWNSRAVIHLYAQLVASTFQVRINAGTGYRDIKTRWIHGINIERAQLGAHRMHPRIMFGKSTLSALTTDMDRLLKIACKLGYCLLLCLLRWGYHVNLHSLGNLST